MMVKIDEGERRSKRIRQWTHELEGWKIDRLPLERQGILVAQLNGLFSKGVQYASLDVLAQIFGDDPSPFLGGLFLGDPEAAERLLERIRSRERT